MSDLAGSEETLRQYRINSIRVFYRLEVPGHSSEIYVACPQIAVEGWPSVTAPQCPSG